MMKRSIPILLALVSLFPVRSAFAQSESAVPFLLITPGARAAGMGEAFVAVADDANATYWNPAGLAFITNKQLSLMHSNWLPQLAPDLFFDYGSYVQHIDGLGTFGLAVTYLNLGSQTITDEFSPTPLGQFSSQEWAIGASFGMKISENTGVGLQFKFIRSNLAPEVNNTTQKGAGSANSFAFDIGLLKKQVLFDKLDFGLNLTNMGPKVVYVDQAQADPLPTNLRMGFAFRVVEEEFNTLQLVFEADKILVRKYIDENGETVSDPFYKALFTAWTDDGLDMELKKTIFNFGLEYWYSNIIALRMGRHIDDIGKVRYWAFGVGLKYSIYQFDFGYVSAAQGHPLNDTMRFSLSFAL